MEVAQERWELYRVLSEPVRLRLLALAAEDELAIGELAELLGESQPNISRHTAPLRQAGLLAVRKQGTRTFVRLAVATRADPVVADALTSGRALCAGDGSLARVAEVIAARDQATREFFARVTDERQNGEFGPPEELAAYLAAVALLLPRRALAVDAGCGDGGFLDVLAPVFARVVAFDRAEPQLARARRRVAHRGYANVELLSGDLASARVHELCDGSADAVFAARVLHHAPQPGTVVRQLADLARPGGALLVLDYARHEDESMRSQADLWLGFESDELVRFALDAGLEEATVARIPAPRSGPDAHLPWQALVARRKGKRKEHG
jgi:DNA-binding transcriptional ArsR family regulator